MPTPGAAELRKRRGAWYTPPELVDIVVDGVCEPIAQWRVSASEPKARESPRAASSFALGCPLDVYCGGKYGWSACARETRASFAVAVSSCKACVYPHSGCGHLAWGGAALR